MSVEQIVTGVIAGIISGAISALLGYAKNAGENFEPKKAIQTLVVGGFIGGVASYEGMSYTRTEEWLESIGAITLLEYIKKAIWRRLRKKKK